ncbi:hypothetical protein [Ruminococcus difficilis]|uniref:Uncharacterized protein n=1 Tax=Ruminococcus difficilis TaxID=2763069 RepID=A0A934TYF6_9FIRM|nr:hypothetical protein [Ruminococcus difficilis]MBK6087662.1 hypothetical protein [Ruminococcus difficilis]
MDTIYNNTERIQQLSQELLTNTRLLQKHQDECDFDRFVSTTKKGARITSNMFLLYRELLLSLKESIPSFPGLDRINHIECEIMGISVEQVADFDFPMYKITLPMLLPNMRRRKEDYNNALAQTVNEAVHHFCIKNGIQPFEHAKVAFLTYCNHPQFAIDNDNKEASVIINGLIGHFLIDDSPYTCDTAYYCKSKGVGQNKTEIYITDNEHEIDLMFLIHDIRRDGNS